MKVFWVIWVIIATILILVGGGISLLKMDDKKKYKTANIIHIIGSLMLVLYFLLKLIAPVIFK